MAPTLRPERKTAPLNSFVEPTLKGKVEAYAKANNVSNAQVVRFALQKFFDSHYEKIVVSHDEIVEEAKDGIIVTQD